MITLAEHKAQTHHKKITQAPPPALVYIPLSQHLGKPCSPEVQVGDTVSVGQRIAAADSQVYAPIHASVSGKVSAIQDWPHPVVGRCKAIVIENDGRDTPFSQTKHKSETEIQSLTPEQIRKEVFNAGMVGLGGASFPTHIKLNPPKTIDSLIINGAECEPYLTGDDRLMVEKTAEIVKGIDILEKCLGAKKIFIGIEDNKPGAIKAFKTVIGSRLEGNAGMPGTAPRTAISLVVLKSQYPQGGEKQLIKNIVHREVPSGKLPFDIGVVVQNVSTVYAIYEALYLGKALYERVLTVSGDCIQNPGNFLVRLGTTVKDLIQTCGPFTKEAKKIIFGGPMMGIAQCSLDTPVIKSTSGILFLSEAEAKANEEAACIRCGRCVEYCPAGLRPCLISMASEKEKWDLAKAYDCLDCMECGLCSYVCPQKRNMVQLIKIAKTKAPK